VSIICRSAKESIIFSGTRSYETRDKNKLSKITKREEMIMHKWNEESCKGLYKRKAKLYIQIREKKTEREREREKEKSAISKL